MKKSLHYFFTAVFVLVALFSFNSKKAEAVAAGEFTGWGWSDTLGWISFNCSNTGDCGTSNYKVAYSLTTGALTGYAWSENVGWIEFGSPSVGKLELNPLSPNYGKLSGWARVLSMVGSSDSESSEWADGWISLSGTAATGATYGITFDMVTGVPPINSYAWGNNAIGWINFSQARVTLVTAVPGTLALTGTSPTASSTTATSMTIPSGATVTLSSTGTNLVSTGGVASGTDATNWTGTKTCPTATPVNYASFVLTNATASTISKTYTLTCTSTSAGTVASTFTINVTPASGSNPKIIIKLTDLNANGTIASPTNTSTSMMPDATSVTPGFDSIQIANGHRVKIEWGAEDVYYPSCEGRNTLSDTNWDWINPGYLSPFSPSSSWGSSTSQAFNNPNETTGEFNVRCKSASAHGINDPYIKAVISVDALGLQPSLTLYANNAAGVVNIVSGGTVVLSSKGNNLNTDVDFGVGNWPGASKGVTCPSSLTTATTYPSFVLNTLGDYLYTIDCYTDNGIKISSSVTVHVGKSIPTPKIVLKVSDLNSNGTQASPTNNVTVMMPDAISPTPGFDQIQIANNHRVRLEWGAEGVYYPSCEGRSTSNDPNWNWSNPSYLAPFAPPSAWGGNSSHIFSDPNETTEEFSVRCKSATAYGPTDPYIRVSVVVDALGKFPSLTLFANGQTNQLGHVINILAGDTITMSATGNNIEKGTPGTANWPTAPTDGVNCPVQLIPEITYENFTLGTLGPRTYTLSCYTDTGNKISSSVTINIVKVIPPPLSDPQLKIQVVKRIGQTPAATDFVSPTSPSQNPSIDLTAPADVIVRWGADNMNYSTCIARTDPTNSNWEWTNPTYAATTTAMGSQEVLGLINSAMFHIECRGAATSSHPDELFQANVTVNVIIDSSGGGGINIFSGGAAQCNGSGAYVEVSAPEKQNLTTCSLEVTNSGGKPVFSIPKNSMPDQHMANLSLSLPANNNTSTEEKYTATLTCENEKPVSTTVSVNYCSAQINVFEGGPTCTVDRSVFLDWDTEKMTSCKILSYDSNMNLIEENKVDLSVPKNKPYEANLVDKITYFKLNCDDGSDTWIHFGGPIKITNVTDLAECKNIKSSVKAPIYKEI